MVTLKDSKENKLATSNKATSDHPPSAITPAIATAIATEAATEAAQRKVLPPLQTTTRTSIKDNSHAWLRLACANLSPRQLTRLLECVESPDEIFEADFLRHLSAYTSNSKRKSSNTASTVENLQRKLTNSEAIVDRALRWVQQPGCHLLTRDCPDYPALLQQIADPPAVLFVEGDPHVLQMKQLAIVGSRRATQPARALTRQWAADLAHAGLVISSGLARGIDGAAHTGCLDAGSATIAVMATGPDDCYPPQHVDLHRQIVATGACVTEFPPGTAALPRFFPQRNRLISGMATATLVVEASIRSGTLVTARHAAEQNRDVFAIPGSVLNPQSAGCHLLIQQGAKLVHQVSDITDELVFDLQPSQSAKAQPSQRKQSTQTKSNDSLLHLVGYDPFTADTLNESSDLPITDIMVQLQTWELEGRIKSLGDGRYQRC